MNEAANYSARVGGQDHKIPPTLRIWRIPPARNLGKNNNRLLTECEGRTGEYWPSIEVVPRPRANIPQCGPRTWSVSCLLYGTRLFLIVKCTSGGLHLKGFRRDVFLMTRTTQTKASYHEFEKQILNASKISLNKTSKTLLTESDKSNC